MYESSRDNYLYKQQTYTYHKIHSTSIKYISGNIKGNLPHYVKFYPLP